MKNTRRQGTPILSTLHHLNSRHGKLYCYPSQVKILDLLCVYQGCNIAIATLNRWLRDLEEKGYLIRTRRIKRDKHKGIMFKSTLYKITVLGYHALKMTGVSVWREIKAISEQGLKGASKALKKFSGAVSMKTILASTGMFGIGKNTYILEK